MSDDEITLLKELLIDNARFHELALIAFRDQAGFEDSLRNPSSLTKAVNSICLQANIPSFELTNDESEELFIKGMNFSEFLSTIRDYLKAALQAILGASNP